MRGEDRPIRSVRAAIQVVGKYRGHNSLVDIAETLLNRWPADWMNGEEALKARLICLECFEGKRPAEDARDAFILALDEAGISIVNEDRLPRYPVPPVEPPKKLRKIKPALQDKPDNAHDKP